MPSSSSLADILERVLDKGVVIAGDIKVLVADVELLTIKVRLLVASVDKAMEIGINWWQTDPYLSAQAFRALEEQRRLATSPGSVPPVPDVPEPVKKAVQPKRTPKSQRY